MKAFRIMLLQKNSDVKASIYMVGESEEKVKKEAERNFNRFNIIGAVTEITKTKKGQQLLSR